MARKVQPIPTLRRWLLGNGYSYPRFGKLIGVSGTSVYMYLAERSNPSEATKQAIERVTAGAVPASSWPVNDRRQPVS